jgi:polyketide cyclase/dehydrase/lipid transport protein
MSEYEVSRSGLVRAAAARVYEVLADYRHHHPRIVPPEYFRSLEVLAGGVGTGTRTRVEMRVLGVTQTFEQIVTEPEPGHLLMEANSNGSTTTFRVEDQGGTATRVTIATRIPQRPGIGGVVERFLTTHMLRRIYRKEIDRLAAYVAVQ